LQGRAKGVIKSTGLKSLFKKIAEEFGLEILPLLE
jgi:hypothetical protein